MGGAPVALWPGRCSAHFRRAALPGEGARIPPVKCFLTQVRRPGNPISFRIFQFVVIYTVKGFSLVNEAEVDIFLKFPCFVYNPLNVGNIQP